MQRRELLEVARIRVRAMCQQQRHHRSQGRGCLERHVECRTVLGREGLAPIRRLACPLAGAVHVVPRVRRAIGAGPRLEQECRARHVPSSHQHVQGAQPTAVEHAARRGRHAVAAAARGL